MTMEFHEFPREEYQLRYEKARQLMEKVKLDVLLITDAINYRYFTGHIPRTNNRPAFFILPLEKEPAIIASADLGTRDAVQMSYIEQVIPYDMPFRASKLAVQLEKMSFGTVLIGLEKEDLFFGSFRSQLQPGGFIEIKEQLPQVTFKDASDLIWKLRSVKTPREIQCIEKACDITAQSYEDTFKEIHPGMTERDVAEILLVSMVKNGADLPALGKPGPSPAIIIDATRPAEEAHVPTGKTLNPGDLLHLDTGVYYNGYCSDFGRSASVGSATKYQVNKWQEMVDRVYEAIDTLRPGMELGRIKCHWHATGMEFVEGPFGGLVNKGINKNVLFQPGMVVCLEDMMSGDQGETYQFEEVVVGTDKGLKILSRCDPKLRQIGL